jgi:hypothetical protein
MWRRIKPRHLLFAVPVVAAVAVLACSSQSTAPSAASSLNVMITDSPFTDATALLVTFNDVSVHASGGAWTSVPFDGQGITTRTCDIKRLIGGAQDVLGTAPLAAGHYTQIRLNVASAQVYFTAHSTGDVCVPGATMPLDSTTDAGTPVTVSSGQLILNRQFDLAATGTTPTQLLLDFNGDGSMVQTGPGVYRMTPVVTVVSVQ